jgi:hypothetical protein
MQTCEKMMVLIILCKPFHFTLQKCKYLLLFTVYVSRFANQDPHTRFLCKYRDSRVFECRMDFTLKIDSYLSPFYWLLTSKRHAWEGNWKISEPKTVNFLQKPQIDFLFHLNPKFLFCCFLYLVFVWSRTLAAFAPTCCIRSCQLTTKPPRGIPNDNS